MFCTLGMMSIKCCRRIWWTSDALHNRFIVVFAAPVRSRINTCIYAYTLYKFYAINHQWRKWLVALETEWNSSCCNISHNGIVKGMSLVEISRVPLIKQMSLSVFSPKKSNPLYLDKMTRVDSSLQNQTVIQCSSFSENVSFLFGDFTILYLDFHDTYITVLKGV